MKKKILIVSLVVFMFLMAPLFTEVLNAAKPYKCVRCDGGTCRPSDIGSNSCEQSGGPLSFCFEFGGSCFDI